MADNRDLHALQIVDPVLSNLARQYKSKGFIARQLVPSFPTPTMSAQYPVFTKSYWFQQSFDRKIKNRAPAREIDFEWSLESFQTEEYALKVSITDKERKAAHPALRLERNKTNFLSHHMEMGYEKEVADLLLTTDDGGQLSASRDSTPSVNWDQATATIESDIKTGVLDVYDTIGAEPNVIVIPFKVAYAIALQEDIRDILANQKSGEQHSFLELGGRVLPAVIHGMRVIVPKGVQQDTSNEGGTSSISEVWSDYVRLLYVDQNAQYGEPSVAYRFDYDPKTVTRWRQNDPDIEYIREKEDYDLKVVAPDAGHIIRAVLS